MRSVYSDEQKRVEVIEVAPGVFFRRGDLPIRDQCNCVYLVGTSGVAVVDAPPGGGEMFEECLRIFGLPLRALFLTHGHGDHCKGLPAFVEKELDIYASGNLYATLSPEQIGAANWVRVEGKLSLTLSGGMEVRLSTLPGTAHSPQDLLVGLPDSGFLCTGDFAVEMQTAYFHSADIGLWMHALRRVHGLGGYRMLLPGHAAEPYPFDYLLEFAAHLEALREAAAICLERLGETHRPSLCAGEVAQGVEVFLRGQDALARGLIQRAGEKDAARSLRMAVWNLLTSEKIF